MGGGEAVSLTELESIACAVARAAARSIVGRRPTPATVVTKSSDTDLVTDVDRATEARLIRDIRARRPHDAILGEEGGTDPGSTTSPVEWVIDPIDGTVNFVLGLPVYSVSVAARIAGRTVAGCVVDVVRHEVFHARAGGGAFVVADGVRRPLRGPRGVGLGQAVVGTGFGYDAGVRARQGRVVAGVLSAVGNIRRLGSAALDICYVADGRLDAYYEAGTAEWDRAAGMLVATESGVRAEGLSGAPAEQTLVVAGSDLFDALSGLLSGLGAGRVLAG